MLKTGMIIAERYEIVGKIGTGGMADVYKAMDHKLNRFVAVKPHLSKSSEVRPRQQPVLLIRTLSMYLTWEMTVVFITLLWS